MVKRKPKKYVGKSQKNANHPVNSDEERHRAFNHLEDKQITVERRIAAIRAIQMAETESLLSRLRLLRSYFDQEQIKVPILEFFQKNLPSISLVQNEKYKWAYELKRNEANKVGIGRDSLQFSVNSATKNLFEAAGLQNPADFVSKELPENQTMGVTDAFQTPGETGNRLSFGMTPKTSRLPKNGEFLLSVHGSPLGVYKEENLEAIREFGNGSHEDASQ